MTDIADDWNLGYKAGWADAKKTFEQLSREAREPVTWQARAKDGSTDWFQVDYPAEHNNPDYFEYRPLYASPLSRLERRAK